MPDPTPVPPCRLLILREPSTTAATLGTLFVDGIWQCWTLEDVDREPPRPAALGPGGLESWVRSWKLPRITAVPIGTYALELTWSPRFRRKVPLLVGVPGFDGVRLHPGNIPADTDGCILPGQSRAADRVGQSQAAYDRLLNRLHDEWGRGVTITIARARDVG